MTTKQKRPKAVILMTPPGTAIFPYLNQPDRGKFAKDKENGDWKTGLRLALADPEVAAFIASLEAAYAANLARAEAEETPKETAQRVAQNKSLGATRPYKSEFADDGSPTGYVQVNFKRAGGGRDKADPTRTWVNTIGLFDTKNQPIDRTKVRIGGGSRIIVAYEINPFQTDIGAGISLRLHAVQVLERADAPTKDAAQYGFKQQDDGFVDDSGAAPMTTETADTSNEGDGNDV
jgi:hypothetical protein